ncbi:hypothetical protein MNBD_GAMMA09-2667 [hydrothermal vent metagenome]|uniref:CheW-like domain-containing protein n=1 Tax=hydrothermal vent metagenome TaxID=652676 RepID=A0A3B0Y238_9ZZZZ
MVSEANNHPSSAPDATDSMKQNLSKQDQAINEYLESLLLDVDTEVDLAETDAETGSENKPGTVTLIEKDKPVEELLSREEPVQAPVVVGLEQLVAEVPDVMVETRTAVQSKAETVTEMEPRVELETAVDAAVSEEAAIEKTESEVPDWGQGAFQCLLFKVSGLSLAVPLVKLSSVIPWDEDITQTPNQTEWYLGLVKHLEHQVKVIDTALLVMPENRREIIDADSQTRLSHILMVDNYQWGLACDSIGDVIWLNKDDVKWRKNKTSRAWLSGTSLEHLCAIMDTEVFARLLTERKN